MSKKIRIKRSVLKKLVLQEERKLVNENIGSEILDNKRRFNKVYNWFTQQMDQAGFDFYEPDHRNAFGGFTSREFRDDLTKNTYIVVRVTMPREADMRNVAISITAVFNGEKIDQRTFLANSIKKFKKELYDIYNYAVDIQDKFEEALMSV